MVTTVTATTTATATATGVLAGVTVVTMDDVYISVMVVPQTTADCDAAAIRLRINTHVDTNQHDTNQHSCHCWHCLPVGHKCIRKT
ncbi:hypothetical protein BDF22DRAFT_686715 [Syncephalis plumigaleata]|nr:hypothetical protein BDF22DRAFT_686715 [Syncephalis plumigaleata]